MAIALRAANAVISVSNASSTTVTLPAGAAAGDICFICFRIGTNGLTVTQTGGSPTWDIHFQGTDASTHYTYAFASVVLTAGFTAPTFSWTTSTTWMYAVIGLRSTVGAPLSVDAWNSAVVSTSAAANTVTPNPVTAAGAGEASVVLTVARGSPVATGTDTGTFTPSSGWTTPASGTVFGSANGTNNRFAGVDYQLGVGPGSIAPATESLTDSESHQYTFVVAHVLAQEATGGAGPQLTPPGRLSPMTLGLPATPVQAPQSPPSGQATPLEALTPPGRQSPTALGLGLTAPSPAPQSPPSGQATPPPLAPPGRLSPASLGLGLTAPSPAPQAPPAGQATSYPLTPPGLQSPMAFAVPLTAPSPAPQTPPAVVVATPTGPAYAPLTPPGLQSPASLGIPLTAPSPAPQSPPAGQATPYPLVPPGLQSPMALTAYLPPGSPAAAPAPVIVTATAPGYAPLTPPGFASPMSIGLPLYAPSPAPQTPPPPPPPPPIPPAIPTSGGTTAPWIRTFRAIAPGDVPAVGAELPRLRGRGYVGAAPGHAEDVIHEPLPVEPGPSIGDLAADAIAAAGQKLEAGVGRALEVGRIFADPPYERHPKRCGAIRKIGRVMLACHRKPGHQGKHSDRGLDWSLWLPRLTPGHVTPGSAPGRKLPPATGRQPWPSDPAEQQPSQPGQPKHLNLQHSVSTAG